ncbi:MAG: HAMP domain-containing histidine kinase [Bacillus sp. (in: Bacteria)]|nr:HAMP domain-containing histidine kinase [Bacillus sp. (in: firmicutes)]
MRSKCFFAAGLALLSGYSLVTLIIVAGGIPFNSFSQLALSFILVQVLGMLLVTYLVEQTRHNKRLKNQVIHQEKLSIINDLSTSFSKEIGTPFTLTKGFLQQLYQENLPPEQKREYIDAALKELQRGEAMTSDFLSLTKNNFEQQVYMDVDRVLHDVVNVISPYADTHSVRIKVETTILDEVWVEGEYQSFQQSLLNLVKNSIEAMPGGGELMIRTAVKSEKVIIEITDTGMGMTKEEVEKLGTPYYTTKEDGTGLGTSIAFSTIKGMRGTIEINSIKGKGTTFTIKLPKSIEDDQKNDYAS